MDEKLKNKKTPNFIHLRRELSQASSEIAAKYVRRTMVSVKSSLKAHISQPKEAKATR